ncbi:hypothetical protein ABG768_005252 [Culter alburnus]|uniref:Uncharacterized protein n=1 Tax=Culter alburnus TaxID=194366 RepID=A0AAW1ZSQ5_CULAL
MNPDPRLGNEDLLNLCEGEIKPTWVTAHLSPSPASALMAQWGGSDITHCTSPGPLKVINQGCVTIWSSHLKNMKHKRANNFYGVPQHLSSLTSGDVLPSACETCWN